MPIGPTGRTIVTTAGVPVRLSDIAMPVVERIDITALPTNAGKIHVGDRNVSAQVGYENGWRLGVSGEDCDVVTLDKQQLYDVWIDSTVNGEGVFWAAMAG